MTSLTVALLAASNPFSFKVKRMVTLPPIATLVPDAGETWLFVRANQPLSVLDVHCDWSDVAPEPAITVKLMPSGTRATVFLSFEPEPINKFVIVSVAEVSVTLPQSFLE